MFSREMLTGILLSKAQFHCRVQTDEKMKIGYAIKLAIDIRMPSYDFLCGVARAMTNYGVESKVRRNESVRRKSPILSVRGIKNIQSILNIIVSETPYTWNNLNHNDTLNPFVRIASIVDTKQHRTLKGLEEILKLKGVLNGTDESQ